MRRSSSLSIIYLMRLAQTRNFFGAPNLYGAAVLPLCHYFVDAWIPNTGSVSDLPADGWMGAQISESKCAGGDLHERARRV